MSDLSCIQNVTEVLEDPYPYVCVEGALPEARYKELCESFPEELVTSTQPHDNGICYRYKSNPALVEKKIPAIWEDFFAYHTSPEYAQACLKLFEPAILKHYSEDFLNDLYNRKVSVRDVDNSGQLVTDCQFVVHEPVDQTGTSRTPHVDNPVEIYAGLLYMRKPGDTAPGGNFTVHRTTGKITEVNKTLGRQVDDSLHEPVREVPYEANNFCMFLNVPDSVHGVTPRVNPVERRRSINIIGEFNGGGRMWKVKEIKS